MKRFLIVPSLVLAVLLALCILLSLIHISEPTRP